MLTIEKNIPLPRNGRSKNVDSVQIPFDQMEEGDSVLVRETTDSKNIQSLVKVRVKRYNDAHPRRKFITGKVAEGIRVWRTQ